MIDDAPEISASPGSQLGIWTSRREHLHAALELRGDATVADLYRRAIDVLGEDPLTTGSLVVGSHCIREFVNRLPRVLGEVQVEGSRGDGSSEHLLERALHEFDEDPSSAATTHLADAARDLIESRRAATERAARMRAALVSGNADPSGSSSTLSAVKRAIDYFEKFRHPQRKDLSRWPNTHAGPVINHLEVIEQALYSRLGRFFDILDEVRDLLETANAKLDGEWVTPTPDTVRSALPRLADPQHRRAFFIGLNNPRWMPELDAQRAFSDPPLRDDAQEGSSTYQQWPQGDYLRKMAAEEPGESAQILARNFSDGVAWSVHELVVATAGEVPREAAAILAKPVIASVSSGLASRFTSVDAVAVVEILAPGSRSQRRKARLIANGLLEPFRDPDSPTRPLLGRFTVISNVDHNDHEDAVKRVVAAFPGDRGMLEDLARWLSSEQVLSGTFDPAGHDVSYIRRPSIDKHRHFGSHDSMSDNLIDAVRDRSADLASSIGLAPVLETLRKHPAPIFLRLELHLLAHEVQQATTQGQPPGRELLAEALRRLEDPAVEDDRTCHRELNLLAAAVLPHLDERDYRRWEDVVLREPDFDEATRTRIATFSPTNFTQAEAVTDFVERSRLDRLSAVGVDALRGRASRMLEELTAKHGPVRTFDDSGEWREEREPGFGFEELSPQQVLDQVARHCANQDATHGLGDTLRQLDHLGRAVGRAVTADPGGFSARAEHVFDHDPIIASYFLSGLADSLREEPSAPSSENEPPDGLCDDAGAVARNTVDWASVFTAIEAAGFESDHSSPVDSQERWRSARKDLCRLLEAGAARDIPTPLLRQALGLAAAMTMDADPTPARDEEVHDPAVRDPLSYSANSVRSCAVHTVLVLTAAHVRRVHGPAGTTSETALAADPVVRDAMIALEHRIEPQRDATVAVAAVFGEHAGWLLRHLPDWFSSRLRLLTTPDAFGEAFVSTSLAGHYPSLAILTAVQPGLGALVRIRASEHTEEKSTSRRRDQSLARLYGDRVIKLYLWGFLQLEDEMLAEYHQVVPIADRASVLTEIGWEMVHADTLESAIVQRAMVLWDSRRAVADDCQNGDLAELAGFEPWVRCGFFPASWWLPRLIGLARATEIEDLHFVGEQLASSAAEHLPSALEALDLLVRQSYARTRGIPYQLRRAAHRILRSGLESTDEAVHRHADDLLNFMGRHSGVFLDPELTALAEATGKSSGHK